MREESIFYFEGNLPTEYIISQDEKSEDLTLIQLQNEVSVMEEEIKNEIEKKFQIRIEVQINFQKGSIDWDGIIKVIWDALNVLSTVGGAIAFAQIISSVINKAIKRRLPLKKNTQLHTKVVPLTSDNDRSKSIRFLNYLVSIMGSIIIGLLIVIIILLFK